ncbi:MAG: hypothetical protein IJL25_02655, partial [Clostridia bacterium]|nr:hypothetical protein [Clostridia bacterium]
YIISIKIISVKRLIASFLLRMIQLNNKKAERMAPLQYKSVILCSKSLKRIFIGTVTLFLPLPRTKTEPARTSGSVYN